MVTNSLNSPSMGNPQYTQFLRIIQREGTAQKQKKDRNIKESEEVKYEENDRTASYTYTDLLTRTVEVDVFDGEDYSPLLPPSATEIKRRKLKDNSYDEAR